jgi:hypothetical protein
MAAMGQNHAHNLQDLSTTDTNILKALAQADGNQSINLNSSPTNKKIDDGLSIHMFLEDLRFLSKHQREKLLNFKTCLKELLGLFDQIKGKMMEMGHMFSEI